MIKTLLNTQVASINTLVNQSINRTHPFGSNLKGASDRHISFNSKDPSSKKEADESDGAVKPSVYLNGFPCDVAPFENHKWTKTNELNNGIPQQCSKAVVAQLKNNRLITDELSPIDSNNLNNFIQQQFSETVVEQVVSKQIERLETKPEFLQGPPTSRSINFISGNNLGEWVMHQIVQYGEEPLAGNPDSERPFVQLDCRIHFLQGKPVKNELLVQGNANAGSALKILDTRSMKTRIWQWISSFFTGSKTALVDRIKKSAPLNTFQGLNTVSVKPALDEMNTSVGEVGSNDFPNSTNGQNVSTVLTANTKSLLANLDETQKVQNTELNVNHLQSDAKVVEGKFSPELSECQQLETIYPNHRSSTDSGKNTILNNEPLLAKPIEGSKEEVAAVAKPPVKGKLALNRKASNQTKSNLEQEMAKLDETRKFIETKLVKAEENRQALLDKKTHMNRNKYVNMVKANLLELEKLRQEKSANDVLRKKNLTELAALKKKIADNERSERARVGQQRKQKQVLSKK
ncbi:hypothetical protein GWK90_07285 [Candidatus Hamiltonella defensa]|uniref:Uncharacterized protein n=1 Tax=Candidatus Williamhamiltonella defendens TaxID=138072 RepID=A0AAC9YG42_9ENTR|nr:hypothetical protein [Candidatus Hamiltonella defensa]ASV33870.1 hypothetical protein CJJ18_07585 [Candidatus Hamiltonella defensa]AWK16830.1 hypothetical protein CCS40_07410 [Candidatus Hamiltonella defensa]MBK4362020.1 hypothetical protein [Candidatus Hamiltonella defensa]